MAELKTLENDASVEAFLDALPDASRQADCRVVAALMARATGEAPRLWGTTIVGFGRYHYRYASGHEGDAALIGFSPRKNDLTLYIQPGFDRFGALLARLGKFKTGKSCLYLKKLADVDLAVLEQLIDETVQAMAAQRVVR